LRTLRNSNPGVAGGGIGHAEAFSRKPAFQGNGTLSAVIFRRPKVQEYDLVATLLVVSGGKPGPLFTRFCKGNISWMAGLFTNSRPRNPPPPGWLIRFGGRHSFSVAHIRAVGQTVLAAGGNLGASRWLAIYLSQCAKAGRFAVGGFCTQVRRCMMTFGGGPKRGAACSFEQLRSSVQAVDRRRLTALYKPGVYSYLRPLTTCRPGTRQGQAHSSQ